MSRSEFTPAQQLAICQQVAQLVRAKLPIAGELSRVVRDASSSLAASAEQVDDRVSKGQSLADALAGDGSRSSRSLAACITAGETCGQLDRTLELWTEMHVANSRSAQAMRSALLYPVLLILVTILSLGSVIWQLIPQYETTYASFHQQLPDWLAAIVWIREQVGVFLLVLVVISILPLLLWYVRRQGYDAHDRPRDPVRRLRGQGLAAEIAALMLRHQRPLNETVTTAAQVAGGKPDDVQQAFERLQRQQPIAALARESTMLLSSLHVGALTPDATCDGLAGVADVLKQAAESSSARQERWIPMIVALSVGALTVLTYVLLIYLPWIWLMRKIAEPTLIGTL